MLSTSGASACSAADLVYHHVKERVLTGELEGGRMVSEGEIASVLTVSRTPVREAFLRLEVEGWLRLFPKRGALVVPIAPREIDEVLEARAVVETHAVADVVGRAHDLEALVGELDDVIAVQRKTHDDGDLPAFVAADAEFHRLIADAGRNSLFAAFYRGLRERQQRMTAESVRGRSAAAEAVLAEHRVLRDLVAAADVEGFRTALVTHLDNTHRAGRGR
jgi:DNA-binding GntR family transcriptional regulator